MASEVGADLSFRAVGFEPMEAGWWPMIAAALPKPWPREAALMDLRWWAGQEHATKGQRRPAEMPGRPALCARWGWADWPVRCLMRGGEWRDPLRSFTSDSPAPLQLPSSDSPAGAQTNADNREESSSDSPAPLQLPSSDPPRARSLYTDPPITDHRDTEPEDLAPASPASAAHEPEAPPVAETIATAATKTRKTRKPRNPKPESEPHRYHQRLLDAWDRCWGERYQDAYPWSPREIAILVKQIRDPLVHRDERGEEDLQRVGRAMRRYLAQQVDGRYVTGLSLRGFAADPARWYAPVDGERPKNGHNGNAVDSNSKTLFDRALALITAKESA